MKILKALNPVNERNSNLNSVTFQKGKQQVNSFECGLYATAHAFELAGMSPGLFQDLQGYDLAGGAVEASKVAAKKSALNTLRQFRQALELASMRDSNESTRVVDLWAAKLGSNPRQMGASGPDRDLS